MIVRKTRTARGKFLKYERGGQLGWDSSTGACREPGRARLDKSTGGIRRAPPDRPVTAPEFWRETSPLLDMIAQGLVDTVHLFELRGSYSIAMPDERLGFI